MPKAVPVFILLLVTILFSTGGAQCHNQCSGHGACNPQGHCDCWSGFEGWDCSLLACPSAPAWADLASGTDDAHNDAVCSNMGYCDGYAERCVLDVPPYIKCKQDGAHITTRKNAACSKRMCVVGMRALYSTDSIVVGPTLHNQASNRLDLCSL